MKYVDQALRHPTYNKRQASKIAARIAALANTRLKCVRSSLREQIRAEILGLYAVNELNLADIAAEFKEPATIKLQHLQRILSKYASYYNEVRTHLSLGKDAPCTRPIERFGDIIAQPILGGLHHRYARI
jgi:hypothetical protein